MKRILAGPKRLWRFFDSTYQELQRITWPTKQQTIRLTIIVVAVCVLFGAALAGWDYLLSKGLGLLIEQ